MVFRRAPEKSETIFVRQNYMLVDKCGFRFEVRASGEAEKKTRVK